MRASAFFRCFLLVPLLCGGCARVQGGRPVVDHVVPSTPSFAAESTSVLLARTFALRPPETTVEAVASSLLGQHVAWFERFEGRAHFSFDPESPSRLELHIDMRTITMANGALTTAIREPEFFGVEQFPRCDFVSDAVTKTEKDGIYHVTGTLDLHGVSRPLAFDVAVVRGESFTTARAELTFNRHDFNLAFGPPYETLGHEPVVVKIWSQSVLR